MSEAARPSEHAVKQPSTELAQRHGTEHESAPPVVDALFERTPLASNATRRQFLAGPPPLEPEGFGSMRGVSARTLLGLQRSAGNAAVTAFLMRSPERPSGGATTAEREPAAGESPRATGPPPAAARVPALASAVGILLQRKPPAAPAAPAPPAAPAKSPAEIAQMVSDSLAERYRRLKEASSQMTWDLSSDRGGPDSSPGPAAAKHTIVGGPAELATKWTGIQDHILKASSGKAPFVALEGLYSTEGMADVKALKPAARQQVADLVRQLLISYATDDQLTGKPTDVETIVNEITSSFWQTYESAGGAAAGPEHIAVPGANSPLFYVKDKWPQIDAQIRKPKQRIERADELMHVVYVGTVPDQLALLQPAERVQVSTTVFDRLTRIASDEGQSGASIEQDWAQLQPPLRGAIENDKAGLVFVRGPLLNTFGSFAAANAFYQALTTATFAGYTGKFIHPALAALITKADATLKQLDPSGALNGSVGFGGLSVRENRNQKTKLSNHSFGCAIDVNADFNPNIPKAVAEKLYPLIEQLTGTNVSTSAAGNKKGTNFMRGMTAAQALPEAERLRAASDELKKTFQNEDTLKQGMVQFAQKYAADKKFALPGTADGDVLLGNAKLVYAGTIKLRAFGNTIYNEQGPLPKDAPGPTATDRSTVGGVLYSMYVRYAEGKQESKSQAIAPSAGEVAKFGFMNLDPRVVAALAGSGGGLTWLGAQTGGVHDYMHFDLPNALLPPEAKMNQ